MNINKYSFNSLFKLAFIFSIILSAFTYTPANADSDNIQQKTNSSTIKNQNSTQGNAKSEDNVEDSEVTTEDSNVNNIEEKEDSELEAPQNNNTESPTQSNFKEILSLFAIIDLPIFALLLTLWFTNKKQQKQQFHEITKKQSSIIQKLDKLETINNKISNLDKENKKIIDKIQENKEGITSSRIILRELIEKPQISQAVISHNNRDFPLSHDHSFSSLTNKQTQHQLDTQNYSPVAVAVADPVPHFVDQYNQDKQSLSNEATAKVSATEASLNKRRMGDDSKLILENTTQKRYLIIQEDGDYFLVPHAKIKINEHNKSSLEALFECVNFIPEYTDFHLIQPAKVSQLDSELWQLDKKGKLEFS